MPLCGGYWSTGPEREPYRRVADALGGQARGLMSPGLVDDAATQRALVAHAGVQSIIGLWERLDVALFGIGGPAWSVARVGEPVERELEAAEAVGEVLVAPFDLDGRFVCPALRDRVIAFDARRLDRLPVSIGVASGEGQGPADPRRVAGRRGRHAGDRRRLGRSRGRAGRDGAGIASAGSPAGPGRRPR